MWKTFSDNHCKVLYFFYIRFYLQSQLETIKMWLFNKKRSLPFQVPREQSSSTLWKLPMSEQSPFRISGVKVHVQIPLSQCFYHL